MRKKANPKVPRLVEKPMPGTMAAYADEYYQWLAERNYSPNTIKNRQVYVYFFMKWADERGLVEPEEVTRPVIEQYQRYLYHYKKKRSEGTLAVNSKYARLIAVCGYFKWLARQNYILYNPTADIIMPRVGKRLPANVLSAEDADQIINQADVNDIMGIRDRAMLETLYSTGVRRSELIEITVYDIDFDRGTVFVHGKGNKDRVIPIGERALVWIQKYLAEARAQLVVEPDDHILFLTARGEPFSPNHLTGHVREYIRNADIGKKGSCHLFRHAMATLMLENGADIRFIQSMLGHSRLNTTEVYTQVSIRKLKEIHTVTHPANLRKKHTEGQSYKAE